MGRPKKNGQYLNLKINQDIYDRFSLYAEQMGQTKTIALERILTRYLDSYEKCQEKNAEHFE